MDKELQTYYEERFSLTSTRGWRDLIEDAMKMRDAYSIINSISTVEDLFYKKGQIDILEWLISLRSVSEEAYKQLQEEDNGNPSI